MLISSQAEGCKRSSEGSETRGRVNNGNASTSALHLTLGDDIVRYFVERRRCSDKHATVTIVEMPHNQDAVIAHLRWAGNLICGQPRKFAALTAIA